MSYNPAIKGQGARRTRTTAKYTAVSRASQGAPTIHEIRHSLVRPIVTKTAQSSVKPANCASGNPGMRTGRSAATCRRRKLKWLARMMIHTMMASNSAMPNR